MVRVYECMCVVRTRGTAAPNRDLSVRDFINDKVREKLFPERANDVSVRDAVLCFFYSFLSVLTCMGVCACYIP